MKPATVLVVAFQVQVGFRASFVCCTCMRCFEYSRVGGAGVKPHFQNIGAFGVVRCVLFAQNRFHTGFAPSFNATGFHHRGGDVHNFQRTGVQFARIFVQEEWHRNTPATLAADAPVGAVGNHVAQAGAAIFRVKGGFFNGV